MNRINSSIKLAYYLSFLLITLLFFTGCGKKTVEDYIGEITHNTIYISDDNSIREIAVEDFSQTEIDTSKLEAEIMSQIEIYCESHAMDDIEFLQYESVDGLIKVAINYKSIDIYNDFNGTSFILGTVLDMPSETELVSMSGVRTAIEDIPVDFKAFMFDEEYEVYVTGDIIYYSINSVEATATDCVTADGNNTVIVFN